MQVNEIVVGTVLKMVEGGGEYRVIRISGDEIALEHAPGGRHGYLFGRLARDVHRRKRLWRWQMKGATLTAIFVALFIIIWSDAKPPIEPAVLIAPPVDTRHVTIDPAFTRCAGQPYGTKQDGWNRLRTQDEDYVEALVKRVLAEKTAPQTLLCRDVTQKPLVEFSLRETWWRKLPRPQRYQNQACGDYTSPEVPRPVVVGV